MNGGSTTTANNGIIEVRDAKKHFPVVKGILGRVVGSVKAVDGVSFTVQQGQTYSLVGESGCGKTTTAKMVLLIEKPTAGDIFFDGTSITRLNSKQRKEYRTSLQAVFQDPWSSLNPRLRVASIIAEPLTTNVKLSRVEVQEAVESLLEEVGLRLPHADHFPHEFSGGQRQRIAIARAISLKPKVIVLDEPVSALDVSIRAQIMNLLKQLQQQYGMSYLLIAHHLATVRYMSHQIGVMYLGKIVEEADTRELFTNPLHPYTKALISASLPSHPDIVRKEEVLSGEVPSPIDPPSGCAFHPRCPLAMPHCSQEVPEYKAVGPRHKVACHLY